MQRITSIVVSLIVSTVLWCTDTFAHRGTEIREIPSNSCFVNGVCFRLEGSKAHTIQEMEEDHGYNIRQSDIIAMSHSGDYSEWTIARKQTPPPPPQPPPPPPPTLEPTTLSTISGNGQQGAPSEPLANPFVVEVQDQNGNPLAGVTVTFTVTAGGGTLTATTPTTDANGQARTTLTLGPILGTNSVQASVEGIEQTEVFSAEATFTESVRAAVADATGSALETVQLYQFELQLQQGWNLIHLPLTVYAVNNELYGIQTAADLYELIQPTFMFIHSSEEGFIGTHEETDITLGPNQGIAVLTDAPATFTLVGTRLPEPFQFESGMNFVGFPRQSVTLRRVSDLLRIYEGAVVVITMVDGEFSVVGRAGDPADHEITGGQSFFISMTAPRQTFFYGPAWGTHID